MSLSRILINFFLVALLLALCVFFVSSTVNAYGIGRIDFVQYWSAAKAFYGGANPYDASVLASAQRGLVADEYVPVRMWNPPLVFPLLWFFSLCDFQCLVPIWFVAGCALMAGSFILLRNMYERAAGDASRRGIAALFFVLTCDPLFQSISYGQLSTLLLGALALSLYLSSAEGGGRQFLAGLTLGITAFKPHLLYLVYLLVVLEALRTRRFNMAAGLAAAVVLLAVIPLGVNAEIYRYYFTALEMPPFYFKTPTLGSWLQEIANSNSGTLRVLPSICTALIVAICFFLRKKAPRSGYLLLLLPLSLFTSPYGWEYDQLLLLPAALWLIFRGARFSPFLVPLLNVPLLLTPPDWAQHMTVWYPATFFALMVLELWLPSAEKSE